MNDHQKEALFTTLARRFDIVLDGMLPHAVSEDQTTVALVGSHPQAGTKGVYILSQLPDIGSGLSDVTWTFQQRLSCDVSTMIDSMVYLVDISKDNSTIRFETIHGKKFKFVKGDDNLYTEVQMDAVPKPVIKTDKGSQPLHTQVKGPNQGEVYIPTTYVKVEAQVMELIALIEKEVAFMDEKISSQKELLSKLKEQLTK